MKSIQLHQVIWMAKPTLYLNVRGAVQRVFADVILTLWVTIGTKHFLFHQTPKLSRNPLLKIRYLILSKHSDHKIQESHL